MTLTTTHTSATECPGCERLLGAATDPQGEARPEPGDVSVCLYCGSFLRFTTSLTVRLLTVEEISVLPDRTRIQLLRMRRAVWLKR